MKHLNIFFGSICCTIVAGCGSFPGKEIGGVNDAFKALTDGTSASVALDVAIQKDFAQSSAALAFVSDGKFDCTGLSTREIARIGRRQIKDIKKAEEKILAARGANFQLIVQYVEMMKKVVKENKNAHEEVAAITGLVTAITQSAVLTAMAPELKALQVAVDPLKNIVDSSIDFAHSQKVLKAAVAMQTLMKKSIDDLKSSFFAIKDETNVFIKAWEQCQDARFNFLKTGKFLDQQAVARSHDISSGVELDNAFYTYRVKRDAFADKIPDTSALLEGIRDANDELVKSLTESPANAANGLTNLVKRMDDARTIYTTVKSVAAVEPVM